MVGYPVQRGATFPMDILPTIPPLMPNNGGLVRGARYPPGDTMNPATVDAMVSRRAAMIRAVLILTRMVLPSAV